MDQPGEVSDMISRIRNSMPGAGKSKRIKEDVPCGAFRGVRMCMFTK